MFTDETQVVVVVIGALLKLIATSTTLNLNLLQGAPGFIHPLVPINRISTPETRSREGASVSVFFLFNITTSNRGDEL